MPKPDPPTPSNAAEPPTRPSSPVPAPAAPLAPEDFYLENDLLVFTATYHLKRGYCCGSGCRHCPYPPDDDPQKPAR